MDKITLGILFGLSALVFNGLAGALTKKPTQNNDPNKVILYRNIFNSILLFVILLFTLGETEFSPWYILYTIGLSIFGYIPMYYFYKAAKVGKMGVISPVSAGSIIITIVLSFLFLREKISTLQILAMILMIFGIIGLSVDFKGVKKSEIFKTSSGIPYALIAALGWGIWAVLAKFSSEAIGPFLTSFIVEFFAIFVALFLLKRSKENLVLDKKETIWQILPISVCMVLWSLSYYQGIKISNLSIIATLSTASPLVTVIYSRIFYKEKLQLRQYLAIVIIILGILGLSLR